QRKRKISAHTKAHAATSSSSSSSVAKAMTNGHLERKTIRADSDAEMSNEEHTNVAEEDERDEAYEDGDSDFVPRSIGQSIKSPRGTRLTAARADDDNMDA